MKKTSIWTPKRIRGLRVSLGETQEGFARQLGVSWVSVSRWETGAGKPSKLAQAALNALAGSK